MALADIPLEPGRRLDSWKEIAEYLRRDVRTATRWESLGLPVHRMAGGRGRSVFAFTEEIDAWMVANPAETAATATAPPDTAASVPAEPQRAAAAPARWRHRLSSIPGIAALGGVAAVAIGAAVMLGAFTPTDVTGLEVIATGTQVSIARPGGTARVIHRFDPGAAFEAQLAPARIVDLDSDGTPEVVAAVSYYQNQPEAPNGSGEMLNLSLEGDLRWRFVFDDEVPFADRTTSGPWVITDWRVGRTAAPTRLAVAAHEITWSASIVSVLDHRGRRLGTFVNPGWIESLAWLSGERLAVAGYNNLREEAMFALLDVNHLDGQAPGNRGTKYECPACPAAEPVFYATFARSELNRLTGAGFNRAVVSVSNDQLQVTTTEIKRDRNEATALYEFDRTMRLVGARYSDSYWDEHVRLELEGRLTHPRERCPDRDGPKAIHVWDAARGWVKTPRSAGQ